MKLSHCPDCNEIYNTSDMELKAPVHFRKTCRHCGTVIEKVHVPPETEVAIRADERQRCMDIFGAELSVDDYGDYYLSEETYEVIKKKIIAGGE